MIRDATRVALPRSATAEPTAERPPAAPPPGGPQSPGLVAPGVPMLNPRMRIETELGLVVLEFRDDAGEVRQSLPSPQEIDAYRLAAREDPAEQPPALDVTR